LPTIAELQTIVSEPFVCAASPCIDEPLFGPTAPSFYWSSTTYANAPDGAWSVTFLNGGVVDNRFLDYVKYNSFSVRAVRGGL
jgi:hypothetical protein